LRGTLQSADEVLQGLPGLRELHGLEAVRRDPEDQHGRIGDQVFQEQLVGGQVLDHLGRRDQLGPDEGGVIHAGLAHVLEDFDVFPPGSLQGGGGLLRGETRRSGSPERPFHSTRRLEPGREIHDPEPEILLAADKDGVRYRGPHTAPIQQCEQSLGPEALAGDEGAFGVAEPGFQPGQSRVHFPLVGQVSGAAPRMRPGPGAALDLVDRQAQLVPRLGSPQSADS